MRFHIFESGSKGNCMVIESDNHRYLMIDNGLTKKKTKEKLENFNISIDEIKALLVTHSHSDHISGISIFSKDILYSTSLCGIDTPVCNYLVPFDSYEINGFKVTCLPTSHDAPGSCGFIIECDNETLVYITDTGYIYEKVCEKIVNKEYYIIESNHNVRMELECNRPQYLKKRVIGDYGHLSNEDSANYMCDVIGDKTKQIILAHLSQDANTPSQAMEDYCKVFEERNIDISLFDVKCASQTETVSGGKLEVSNG